MATTLHTDGAQFEWLPIDRLIESKTNPRKTFDLHSLVELAQSIRRNQLIILPTFIFGR